MEREVALELLRSQHEFPGIFTFRVVAQPDSTGAVLGAMGSAIPGDSGIKEVRQRLSRKGNYVALHVDYFVPDAEAVLAVYEVLRTVDGVMTTL